MSGLSGPVLAWPRPGLVGHWLALAAAALLLIDALCLMSQGMFNVGVLLPFVIGLGVLARGLAAARLQAWLRRSAGRQRLWRWGQVAACVWLLSVLGFWLVLARQSEAAQVDAQAPAAILVLGSGAPNGVPSPTLVARLDTALAQAARYPQAMVLVSGGVDFGQTRSEGAVMGHYLREHGLPQARIVQEERSTSTEENLLFSQPLLAVHGVSVAAPIQVVTSDFHTLRARWIARRAGYRQVQTVGAPTPLMVRYNAWLREYFAVISGFVLREF